MSKLWHWVKEHPWMTGLAVFGIGALYIILRGSGSSSSSDAVNPTTGLTDAEFSAELAANTQLQGAQIQANTASQGISASEDVSNTQTAAGVTNTTTAGNVQLGVASDQTSVANTSTAATLQASLAQTNALEAIALAPYQVEEDELNSTGGAAVTQLEGQVTALTTTVQNLGNETATGFANINGQTSDWYGYPLAGNVFPGSSPTNPTSVTTAPLQNYDLSSLPVVGSTPATGVSTGASLSTH